MSKEVDRILEEARARDHARASVECGRDYAACNIAFKKQKAALTRAINSKDPNKVVMACRAAVQAWSKAPFDGAWPDDWSRWQRALDDALGLGKRVSLESLR